MEQRLFRGLTAGVLLSVNVMNLFLRYERLTVLRLGLTDTPAGTHVRQVYQTKLPGMFQSKIFTQKQAEFDRLRQDYLEVLPVQHYERYAAGLVGSSSW